jgi:hypothetical protein
LAASFWQISQAQRAQGVQLGNRANIAVAGEIGRQSAKQTAQRFASNVMPLVRSIQASRITSLGGIAQALNSRGIRTARGGQWHVSTVMNLLVLWLCRSNRGELNRRLEPGPPSGGGDRTVEPAGH